MAATPLYASLIPAKAFINYTKSLSQFYFITPNPRNLWPSLSSPPSLRASKTTPLSALPSTALEAEQAPGEVSSTPSKALPFRVGHGFDLHRLEPGYPLIIGGINIPHERGCEAHSDGDFHDLEKWVYLVFWI